MNDITGILQIVQAVVSLLGVPPLVVSFGICLEATTGLFSHWHPRSVYQSGPQLASEWTAFSLRKTRLRPYFYVERPLTRRGH